jgi:pimeloyl-ACP methyl ester carboxylesterase
MNDAEEIGDDEMCCTDAEGGPMDNRKQSQHFVRLLAIGFVVASFGVACAPAPPEKPVAVSPKTIVFVHGAWGGGWQFHKVQPLLENAGHRVSRPTMTGLGERFHLARPDVGLSTHVEDIVNHLAFEDLHEIVLVGHSYGGMVISGVAERVPHRIAQLVYMDAIVPEDGDSVAGLFGDAIETMAKAGGDGDEPWQLVPVWVEEGQEPPVDVPQPLLTFTESITLGNPEASRIPTTFILTVEAGKETDDFDLFADRARERRWTVVEMEGGHNPQWYQPENFAQVLLRVIED